MPVGKFPTFAACVRANQDKRDPGAFCAEIERRIKKRRKAKRRKK